MIPSFTNNPSKDLIRQSWNTPILRRLSDLYGIKYRYLGLPGVDLIDILLWRDMIEEVIAFEPPAKTGNKRQNILTLRGNLRKNLIPGYAFYGSIEQVVILRKDVEGQVYRQNNLITLYNLDFCDEICSKIFTLNSEEKIWRYEALRTIIADQKNAYLNSNQKPNTFILLITVRNQIDSNNLRAILSDIRQANAMSRLDLFRESLTAVPESRPLIGSHGWGLKIFLYDFLCNCFDGQNISALFFPFIFYYGTPIRLRHRTIQSPMLHLMLVCQFGDFEARHPDTLPQNFLNYPCVEVNDGRFNWKMETEGDIVQPTLPNPVTWLDQHCGQLMNKIVI